jgi:hypothetical protein
MDFQRSLSLVLLIVTISRPSESLWRRMTLSNLECSGDRVDGALLRNLTDVAVDI